MSTEDLAQSQPELAPPSEGGSDSVVPIEQGKGVVRRLTEKTWRLLLECYRTQSNHATVAQLCRVDRRTAKKAYYEGMNYSFAKTPIKVIVENEQAQARAAMGNNRPPTAEEINIAQGDAVRQRADEARMIRVAKGNVLGVMAYTSKLVLGGNELAERMKKLLETYTGDPQKSVRVLRDIASMTRANAEAVEALVLLERRLLGEAQKPTGHEPMTEEEARRELEEVVPALARAKERWGGAGVTPPDVDDDDDDEPKGGF